MRVRDKETRLILESDNELTITQWLRHPEKYKKLKKSSKNEPMDEPMDEVSEEPEVENDEDIIEDIQD